MAITMEKWRKLAISVNLSLRCCTTVHQQLLHNGPDAVEELLERHIVKKEKSYDDDEDEVMARWRLTSTRREVHSLYGEILRATRFFSWPDSRGVLWRDVLRENARKEFEEARLERDPEVITRLLIGGRDALQDDIDKILEKQKQQMARDQSDGDRR